MSSAEEQRVEQQLWTSLRDASSLHFWLQCTVCSHNRYLINPNFSVSQWKNCLYNFAQTFEPSAWNYWQTVVFPRMFATLTLLLKIGPVLLLVPRVMTVQYIHLEPAMRVVSTKFGCIKEHLEGPKTQASLLSIPRMTRTVDLSSWLAFGHCFRFIDFGWHCVKEMLHIQSSNSPILIGGSFSRGD